MPGRALPVIYSRDVPRAARFYEALGFQRHYRLLADGEPGYVGPHGGEADLGIVTAASPEHLVGVQVGSQPRIEMFVYVDDVDAAVAKLRRDGAPVLRELADMPWGERVAYDRGRRATMGPWSADACVSRWPSPR